MNAFKEENRHIILFITLYIISTLYIRPGCVRYDSSASAEGTSALFTKLKRIKMRPRELKRYMKLGQKFRNSNLKSQASKGQNQTHGGAVAHRLAHVRLLCSLTARTLHLSFYWKLPDSYCFNCEKLGDFMDKSFNAKDGISLLLK